MSNLIWIQKWYLSNCDGDWEHAYGISIGTLDNPGWSVTINLRGTQSEGLTMDRIQRETTDSDWVHCSISNMEFQGAGGPENLDEILQIFRALVDPAGK
jgi:hypothetical protein